MTPQQQNADAKEPSHIYVQKPNGEALNIPVSDKAAQGKEEGAGQTASNTPTAQP